MRLVTLRDGGGHALASPSGHVLLLSVIAEPARALRPVMTARTAEGRTTGHGSAFAVGPTSGFTKVNDCTPSPTMRPHQPTATTKLEA